MPNLDREYGLVINRRKARVGRRNRLTFYAVALASHCLRSTYLARTYYHSASFTPRHAGSFSSNQPVIRDRLLLYVQFNRRLADNGQLMILALHAVNSPRPIQVDRRSEEWHFPVRSLVDQFIRLN